METKNELQRNALRDARKHELELFQRALDIQWLNSRMEDGRMGRCLALIQKEADMERDFQERTDHAALVNARARKETDLGIEIAKVQREQTCELMRRHYIRERDPALKELMRKLQAGYVCRDLQQQILHNEYRRLQEKAEDKHANTILEKALYQDIEREKAIEYERNQKYCQELQQQLVSKQQQRQCQYEDTLIEKKMLDDIMRTIADEDQRELQQKRQQTEKMRREMVTFQRARDAWKVKQKQMVVEEERQIEGQQRAMANRSEAVIAERNRKMQMKEELNQRIAAKILAEEGARREREDIIKLLQEQECLEKNAQDDILKRTRARQVMVDTKETLTTQFTDKKRMAEQGKRAEVAFRVETAAKIAAEEAKEAQKHNQLRAKNRQYAIDLLKQMEEDRARKRKEKEQDEKRAKDVYQYADEWRAEVSKEREKIVEEHVPQLLGYLQAGVIGRDELGTVKRGAASNDRLKHLDIGALERAPTPLRRPKCNAQCRVIRNY